VRKADDIKELQELIDQANIPQKQLPRLKNRKQVKNIKSIVKQANAYHDCTR
jgi:hypothetical protein